MQETAISFREASVLREDPRMVCFIAVLIPRRTIEAVGLLDEDYDCYSHQDDDYCHRVRKAGLKIGRYCQVKMVVGRLFQ
jgi:GT2 family glycosyltransferase